jgi:hypothetical protein
MDDTRRRLHCGHHFDAHGGATAWPSIQEAEKMTQTIIVAQGMCSPIRGKILTLFRPYGFKNLKVKSYSVSSAGYGRDGATFAAGARVDYNVAEITVSDASARWAEYLICRAKVFRLMSTPLDPRNEVWASKWDTLPRAWTQPDCKPPAVQKRPGAAKRKPSLVDRVVRMLGGK